MNPAKIRILICFFAISSSGAIAGDASDISLGVDFTRSISFESPADPLADFSDFRIAVDGKRIRVEFEGGYFFDSRKRKAGDGTSGSEAKTGSHYLRTAFGVYYRNEGETSVYGGPRVGYRKLMEDTRQDGTRLSRDLDLVAAGLVLGLERNLVARLSLAGEFQALYGLGWSKETGLGTFEETDLFARTSASLVFRWKLR